MLTVNFVWTCDYCGETKVVGQRKLVVGNQEVDYHQLPTGWNVIRGQLVCPKHQILVKPNQEEPADAFAQPGTA